MTVQMDFMRRGYRISRLQHVRNETIKREIGLQRTVIEEIETQRLKWYDHMRRMEEHMGMATASTYKKRKTESRIEYADTEGYTRKTTGRQS
ncbi:hypothetical protein ILUMI_17950, partial [Ignelater luminosus]